MSPAVLFRSVDYLRLFQRRREGDILQHLSRDDPCSTFVPLRTDNPGTLAARMWREEKKKKKVPSKLINLGQVAVQ